jgi:hypothetical protein
MFRIILKDDDECEMEGSEEQGAEQQGSEQMDIEGNR